MKISPIDPYVAAPLERVSPRTAVVPTESAAAPSVEASRTTGVEIPAKAPRGTDEKLWSVLTSAERTYFGRARAASTPVYGPSGGLQSMAMRGQALNLRA